MKGYTNYRAETLLNLVGDHFKMPISEIVSKSRDRKKCLARQVSAYLIRKYTPMTQGDVAEILNYKDHSSVWRDERNIPELILFNKNIADLVVPLLKKAEVDNLLPEMEDDDFFDFYSEAAFEQTAKGIKLN